MKKLKESLKDCMKQYINDFKKHRNADRFLDIVFSSNCDDLKDFLNDWGYVDKEAAEYFFKGLADNLTLAELNDCLEVEEDANYFYIDDDYGVVQNITVDVLIERVEEFFNVWKNF